MEIKKILKNLYYNLFDYGIIPQKDEFITVNAQGVRYLINKKDGGSALMIRLFGYYEPLETELFRKYVKKEMTVVDIGAYIGYYSMIAAKLAGKKGRVYAFECNNRNYERLLKNIKLNNFKNVIPAKMFVSDKEMKFNRKIDVIKIDTDGSEHKVLNGLKKIIGRDRPILFVELNTEETFKFLKSNNYMVWGIMDKIGKVEELMGFPEWNKRKITINLFCLPNKK